MHGYNRERAMNQATHIYDTTWDILKSSKAYAAINGRSFVTPDDIKFVAFPVLNHRVQLMPEKEMEGVDTFKVIKRIIESIEVPR
jgi:MoxR-like ATPase